MRPRSLLQRLHGRLRETLDLRDLVSERERQFLQELARLKEGSLRHPDGRRYSRAEIVHRQDECRRHLARMQAAQEGLGDWPLAEAEAVARVRARYRPAD